MRAIGIDTIELTKRFGAFTALDAVNLRVRPGTVHALLGENGAGKSTLVKCLVGYHLPDAGAVLVNGREAEIASPQQARALGIGMVYQHFTLVPSMTVAENLALAKGGLPAVMAWRSQRAAMQSFMQSTPFKLDLDARVSDLSAGQKQKTEILKQLYADNRFLILDEPTSVLTPEEADELLGAIRSLSHAGQITTLLITHKFREVTAYADDVSVLRRGCYAGGGAVSEHPPHRLAELMVGTSGAVKSGTVARHAAGAAVLQVHGLRVLNDAGQTAVDGIDLAVHEGEIVGIAGVAGNGQKQLVAALTGQARRAGGEVLVDGKPFNATRAGYRDSRVAALPEEPAANAVVPHLSVAQNMALRNYDVPPVARWGWLSRAPMRKQAQQWIESYGIKTRGPDSAVSTLSGGNVQRTVLARELAQDARLLIVMNPVFGLDFAAVAEIHARLIEARDRGCAILLVSEDLDELLELSSRVLVMHAGRIVFESQHPTSERTEIGRAMGGHHGNELV
ncbi:MAG: ABC transporter ATP-binding protein, partial [Burkholderiaceae bacterium]